MALTIDFVGDATAILLARLVALGYQLPAVLSEQSVRMRYFNVQHRLIPRRPRSILRAAGFACPPEVQAGLTLLERKVAQGDDLRPHLSRGLLDAGYSDALLNDWGIYHFHLGTTLDQQGFIARTKPVLFARIEADTAYFIDVRLHGRNVPAPWSSLELLRCLHANWPATIEPFRAQGVVGLAYAPGEGPPTDEQIAQLRNAGVNVLHELAPGAVYAPPGYGYATDGTSVRVVQENDRFVDGVRGLERQFRNGEATLRRGLALPDPVAVRLELQGTALVAVIGDDVRRRAIGTINLI